MPPKSKAELEQQVADFAAQLAFTPEILELRDSSGSKLTKEARRAMLREVRQGEPHELVISALVFRQSKTPRPLPAKNRKEANANFSLFEAEKLEKLAKSFRQVPFMRDHSHRQSDVGGLVESSELTETDQWFEVTQTIRLQAQWAVESALDGTLRTFSIGARFDGRANLRKSLVCTVCGGSVFSADCAHWPGQEVKRDESGQVHIVEWLFKNMRGAELSATPFPAVEGTGVDGIRAALSQHTGLTRGHKMDKIAAKLGLSETATEADILAALDGRERVAVELKSQADDAEVMLASKDEVIAQLTEERESLAAKLSDLEDKRKAEQVAQLTERALAEGRIRPGNEHTIKAIAKLAEQGIEIAEEFVNDLPKRDPIGPGSTQTEPVKRTAQNNFGMTDQQLRLAKAAHLTPEQWAKHNLDLGAE